MINYVILFYNFNYIFIFKLYSVLNKNNNNFNLK